MTMIELLLSLSLMSMLMLTIVAWTQTTARTAASLASPARWHSAAQRVLQLIHDDLITGDFEPAGAKKSAEPVKVSDGALVIRTRDRGPAKHEFRFDPMNKELRLKIAIGDDIQPDRLLLQQIETWQCSIDDQQKILSIEIESFDGESLRRSYLLP